MDFYTYYLRRIENRPDQRMALNSCKDMAISLFERGPLTWSVASGAALLTALHEARLEPGIDPMPIFEAVEQALFSELQGVRLDIDANTITTALKDNGYDGPPYVEPDYEVREEDVDDGGLQDEPDPDEPPDTLELERLYGVAGESGETGCRRPFPDWAHIADWSQADWIALQTYKSKVLAAAEHGFMSVSHVAGVLSAAKDAMCRITLPRQVELAQWATEITDGLIIGMEDDLEKMCAGSLHSHAGRLVQKHMQSVTDETLKLHRVDH